METPVTASLKLAVKFTVVLLAEAPLAGAMLTTVGTTLSTVALLVSARVVLPMLLVAVMLTLRLLAVMPAATAEVAVQVPALLVAATAAPPPNWLKSTVTPVMPLLLSPLVVLFQLAVTVSPSRKAPPVPLAPAMLICPSVTVGGGIVQVTVMSMLWPSARYWKLKKLSGLVVQPRACIAPLSM